MVMNVKIQTKIGVRPYRFKQKQLYQMVDANVFPERTRVELVAGLVVKLPPKDAPHCFAVCALGALLRPFLNDEWRVFEEKTLEIGRHWLLDPDINVIRGPWQRYWNANPTPPDSGLIIEVAESTYLYDRRVKWRKYAAAGISTYWIVNLNARRIEVFTEPQGAGKAACYRAEAHFGPEEQVPVVLEGREIGRIRVGEILPRTNRPEETSKE